MLTDPLRKLVPTDRPGRNPEDDALRIVDGRVELVPIEREKDFDRRVADPLVPSTNGWLRMSENPSAAAFSTSVG